ncbi:hypothetical protein J7L48_09080, partial [bacterium]|nr:hypothetical protein [bacterium]
MGNDKKRDLIIEALSRYLPKRIVEKIVMEPEKIHLEGERRRATLLFMDISGFTAISENLDPEEVVSTVNGFFNAMSKIIDKYDGDIDKFMGDAMLVLWGTPIAHEDDDERAVRAGMEMMAALDDYNMSRPKEIREKFPISMTMGINSGVVFAGNVGSEKRMEYTVMGDNVNLAARLEGMANPREIMISGETAGNLSDEILLKDLGKVPVKGKVEPVQVYLIAGLKSEMGEVFEKKTFYFPRPKLEKQLSELIKKNNFIEIIGKAGTGKTELVRHNLKDFQYFSINASEKNTPFGFVKSSLTKVLNISLSDNIKNKQLKLQGFIKKNNEFLNDLSVFIDLFDIKSIYKGEEKKWKIFELAEKIFNKFFNNVIIDKFDLIDELSLNFVRSVIETTENKKIVFISRERILTDLPSLNIATFSHDETKNYILKYFNKSYAPDEIIDKIFSLSKGNASIINGFLNYLEKNNLIFLEKDAVYLKVPINKVKLPNKFQGVVLSIFDSYDEYTKKFLQYGAVFGEKFNVNDLNKIINYKPGRVEGSLRNLISDKVLHRDGDNVFFLDENLREAVYNILLKSKRKELHSKIANIFEGDEYDIFSIANHALLGINKKKAIDYGLKAIDVSYANYDNNSTLNYAEKTLNFIDKKDNENLTYVLEKKMKSLYRLSYFELAINEAKNLINIFKKNNFVEKYFDVSNIEAGYFIQLGKIDRALKILNNLIETEIKEKSTLKFIFINFGVIFKIKNDIKQSMEYYLKALKF